MKIVACYSNKGGVGKTAASVNLAYASGMAGWKTLLCDLDPQGASGFYFRVKPSKKLPDKSFFKDEKRLLKAVRASDYDNLDLLPANMSFRDFDIFLSQMKSGRSRLNKALKIVKGDYDVLILDCPPNISLLSENVFKTADLIAVPVIPTTLSARTLGQLYDFFKNNGFARKKLMIFFSMVQLSKKLHHETMTELRQKYKNILDTQIPFATEVERMGVHRAPVQTFAGNEPVARAFDQIWQSIEAQLQLR
jgi:chromosome partitioning protein